MSIQKCRMSVCGRLNCENNYNGQCYNRIISLDENGKCVCYKSRIEKQYEYKNLINDKDPINKNTNLC